MEMNGKISITWLATFLILLHTKESSAAWHRKDITLIENTCNKIQFGDLCKSALERSPDCQSAIDVRGLAYCSLVVSITTAKDTVHEIRKLYGNSRAATDPKYKTALDRCYKGYNLTISDEYLAAKKMDSRSYREASNLLIGGAVKAVICEQQFHYLQDPRDRPLTSQNNFTMRLCEITQSIIKMLF